MSTKPIDALTLAVIQAGLQQVCNEMDIAFSRSAFSPVIAEADDRADGIYDRDTGALISQGEFGLPVFVGVMQYSTKEIIRLIREGKAGKPEPGDIYIVNDPYLGGTHLDGRALRQARLHRGRAVLLAAEYRPLARYRRHGAGRLLGPSRPRWSRKACACHR